VGDRGGSVIGVDGVADLASRGDAGAGDDPGDLDLGHRRTAVLRAHAAVVSSDDHAGVASDVRFLQAVEDLADVQVGLGNGGVVLFASMAVLVACPSTEDLVKMV
jgi:hypothetical protein